jgi:predicted 2-oxoglutarate/Fe(II)-dependent dioxygenase YbiX
LCKSLVDDLKEKELPWEKHAYNEVTTATETTYSDDLDVIYIASEVKTRLQHIFQKCVEEYRRTVPSFSFSLQNTTPIRFNRYNVGTNMKLHYDHIHTIFDGARKGVPLLSIVALLNDDFEGGDFLMFDGKKVKLSAGDILIFPSNFMYPHEVTTVTKGTRYSCVCWAY